MKRIYEIETTEDSEKFMNSKDSELIALKVKKFYFEKVIENIGKEIEKYE